MTKPSSSELIGQTIKKARLKQGLSQAALAARLKTSQSNVNQLEKGARNLNLKTIDRLSQALGYPIINASGQQANLKISGGRTLSGELEINPSKNSTCFLLLASLLNRGVTILENINQTEETNRLIEVLKSLGASCFWLKESVLEIRRPSQLKVGQINKESGSLTRSAILLVSLLANEGGFEPTSGGCQLGKRSNTAHYLALSQLGLKFSQKNQGLKVSGSLSPSKKPIIMYESGDTASANAILAAAQIPEKTKLKFVSANYQVYDLCVFLKKLGVEIKGLGTTTLEIVGFARPPKVEIVYQPLEDPVETMTLLALAIATDSKIKLKRAPLDYLELELGRLELMGAKIKRSQPYLAANGSSVLVDLTIDRHRGKLKALNDKISARPFPGLNIDNLPYFVPIASVVQGTTLIHDWVYENRAIYYTSLNQLGAKIDLADPHRVFVHGPTEWRPANISCPQALRPATIILIAMLAAPGSSTLYNTYTVNRGYHQLVQRLSKLGAQLETIYS